LLKNALFDLPVAARPFGEWAEREALDDLAQITSVEA
jgi:hypothetical protein